MANPLYEAHVAAANELAATQARHAQELADVQARVDATKAALLANWPEGETYCMEDSHPPTFRRAGNDLVAVVVPPLPQPTA